MKYLECQGHQREQKYGALFKTCRLMRVVMATLRGEKIDGAQGQPWARKTPRIRADINPSVAGIAALANAHNITVAAACKWK